jgi:flavin-dependent dehydrogenase
VWDRFRADGHTESPGIVAAWGQAEPYANDFLRNPYGAGWHVDRNRFDAMLAGAAAGAGADVRRRAEVVGCAGEQSGRWALDVRGTAPMSAGVVVDATGRASRLAGRLGGRRVLHDRLVALVGLFGPPGDDDHDRRALIEATPDGWWYSAPVPDGRLLLAFHTDARPGLRAGWDRHLAAAPLTAARAESASAGGVRYAAANSQRREPAAGTGWLAAGDAAAAHDPVAGLGVYWALESGMAAAETILAGAGTAAYATAAAGRFTEYLAQRALYYRAEPRWPDSPFWRRRQDGGVGYSSASPTF